MAPAWVLVARRGGRVLGQVKAATPRAALARLAPALGFGDGAALLAVVGPVEARPVMCGCAPRRRRNAATPPPKRRKRGAPDPRQLGLRVGARPGEIDRLELLETADARQLMLPVRPKANPRRSKNPRRPRSASGLRFRDYPILTRSHGAPGGGEYELELVQHPGPHDWMTDPLPTWRVLDQRGNAITIVKTRAEGKMLIRGLVEMHRAVERQKNPAGVSRRSIVAYGTRKTERDELAALRADVAQARARTRAALVAVRAGCKRERRERTPAELAAIRLRHREQAKLEAALLRASKRAGCDDRKGRVKTIGAALVAKRKARVKAAAARQRVERRHLAERTTGRTVKARVRAAERRSESDSDVAANLPAELLGYWQHAKARIKGSAHRSRTEAFLEHVEENRPEVEAWQARDAERSAEREIREHEKAERKREAEHRRARRRERADSPYWHSADVPF